MNKYRLILADHKQPGLSKELQIGKAAEHFVCANLILQGYNAFLTDQGLPYDIITDTPKGLKRIQVRSTMGTISTPKQEPFYRFGLRKGKGSVRSIKPLELDFFAFVALDILKIAYIPISVLMGKGGYLKTAFEFKSRSINYTGRVYSNGTIRKPFGKFIEDYGVFRP